MAEERCLELIGVFIWAACSNDRFRKLLWQ
jgi:hypothetical protein